MKYRKIDRYKYELMETLTTRVPIDADVLTEFIELADGFLTIREGYCWDGASGPTIDTRSTMRGSLVHDALYQLMRMGLIGQENKPLADQTFRRLIRKDGMGAFRAWYYYNGVHFFGRKSAQVQNTEPEVISI